MFQIILPFRAIFVAIAAFLTCDIAGAEVQVFAAASLTDVLQNIGAEYERKSGDKILFNFAASSILARQIQEGAPADVFVSADEEKIEGLEQKGLVAEGSPKRLLSNSLVIVVRKTAGMEIHAAEDLQKAKRIAIAEPNTVPAGIYARKYLKTVGLWESVQNFIVPTENVRGALAAVESGNVDAAIVYKTDAAISTNVKIACPVPEKDAPPIRYVAAVLKRSKVRAAAGKFFAELSSEDAGKVFTKFGFVVVR